MNGAGARPRGLFGQSLAEAIDLPSADLDLLVAALLLTAAGVFAGGNLLLLDAGVLATSARIALPCVALLLVFYALSRRLGDPAWGLVLTYGLLWLLVQARSPLAGVGLLALAVPAGLYALRALRVPRRLAPPLALMAAIATVTVLGTCSAYTSFDMLPRLHAGLVHQDTLFHASIAAMIKHYGVVSTGLNGLVTTPYHAFSHTLMAGLSQLSGAGVLEVYGVATGLLFAPLLVFAVAATCARIAGGERPSPPLAWAFTAALLAVAPVLLRPWGLFDSFFTSESYLVSLGLFTLGLPLLFKRHLSPSDGLLLALLSAMIADAKASVGLVYAGLWLTRLVFLRRGRSIPDLGAVAVAALVAGWVVAGSVQSNAETMAARPFDFVVNHVWQGGHLRDLVAAWADGGSIAFRELVPATLVLAAFLALHFLVSWVVIARMVRRLGWAGTLATPLGAYCLAAVLAGTLVVCTMAIPGGSAYYFSSVALFVALPGAVAMLAEAAERRALDPRAVLLAGVVVVSLVNGAGLYRASALRRPDAAPANALVSELLALRATSPPDVVWRPGATVWSRVPVTRCSARPFIFPAVSERPWVDVIQSPDGDCRFVEYLYSRYGFVNGRQEWRVAPRLLPGMSIADWP